MSLKRFSEFEGSMKEEKEEGTAKTPWLIDDGDREIIGVEWRGAGKFGTVGIVATKNLKMDYWCAYLGIAEGHDEKKDAETIAAAESIADYGNKMVEKEARAFFPHFKDLKYKKAD